MKYLKASILDQISDDTFVYVNRNLFNTTIAEYEINIEHLKCNEELEILLLLWRQTHELEKRTKRIEGFIKMTNKDIKKCFKQYKTFPLGSFASPNVK